MFTSWMSGMSGQDHLAREVWKSFSRWHPEGHRVEIFVHIVGRCMFNLWHCIQVTCRVSCPFGIHLRSLQRWPTSHIAEHVDQSSHGPKWCWQITGQGTWYGKEDLTKSIKGRLWVNAQKHVLRNKKKQQFCLVFDGPFVDLGLDHSFDIKFFWKFCPFWNQKICQ